MDWSTHYPAYFSQPNEDGTITQGEKKVEWADVGCGFGGLLMALAPLFPEKLMLGTSTRRFSMNTRPFKLTLYTSLWSPLLPSPFSISPLFFGLFLLNRYGD